MIIDSSVLVAILRVEPGYERFVLTIAQAKRRLLAAPSFLETTMVLAGSRPLGPWVPRPVKPGEEPKPSSEGAPSAPTLSMEAKV
jgi:uncharacterized protein with PIN domain